MKYDFSSFLKDRVLKVNNKNIVTSFSHNSLNINALSKIKNKIVIVFRPGDLVVQQDIDLILENAEKRNTFYIFFSVHDIDLSNLKNKDNIVKFFFIPAFYHFYSTTLTKKEIESNILKHFISTNSRIDFARTSLFFYFVRNNLLEKSYFTYLGEERPITFDDCISAGAEFYLNEFDCSGEPPIDIKSVKNMIPLTIDDPIPILNEGGDWSVDKLINEYQQSFLSVVIETYCGDNAPFFTEKIFKPIAMKQPFILMNSKYSLKALRDLGFKTFDGVIDETYDTLDNPDRFETIFREIKRISNFSIDELKEKYNQLEHILEHNYNHFYNVLPKIYETEIEKIGKDVDILIQNKLQLLQ